jgi:glycosyltransferase involved in cell wall biosynthesis
LGGNRQGVFDSQLTIEMKKLLTIGTDRKIFEKNSAVRARVTGYGILSDELHIIIFAKKNAGFIEEKISENVFIYPTQSTTRFGYIFDAIKIGRLILSKDCQPSTTDWTISCQDPFETGLVGTRLSQKFSMPLELQIHTDIGSPYFTYSFLNKIRMMMARYMLPKASHIRVVSARVEKYLVDQLKIDSSIIEIRPITVDVEKLKNSPVTIDLHKKYPQFKKIVLMASRLEKEKNIAFALRVWKKVSENISDAGLIIVGSGGEESALKSLTQKLGLEKSVAFEPWTNELFSYYKVTDVFLLTSFFEGYGMTLVEANAVDCVIVSSDVGVAPELSNTTVCPVNDDNCFEKALVAQLTK